MIPGHSTVAAPEPPNRATSAKVPLAVVIVSDHRLHLHRLLVAFYGSDFQLRQFIPVLAHEWHGNGKVFRLRQPIQPPCWSVPATRAYAAALYAVLAAEAWIEIIWRADVQRT